MKTVLITGGSRGIGAELVRRFSKEGYGVAFVYHRSEEAAAEVAEKTGAFPIRCDVSSEDEAVAAVKKARELLGHIDLLINNAAISGGRLFTDITGEEWNRFFAVNLHGAFYFSREVLREMIARKSGKIINISSMWGEVGASCEAAYSVTKAGLIGMTKALAKELGPSGIRVNAVSPGCIETDMMARFSPEERAALADETPLGFIGQTSDAAEAVAFLASEKARFITGQVLGVNGGFVI